MHEFVSALCGRNDLGIYEKCGERDWVRGFMLRDWPAQLYGREQAAADDGYCIYGKRAEAVVAEAYAAKLFLP
ncbi:hypothetical protein HMSSN036_68300 [Paenibacillus macerans]|uniref:glycoside hydrolase family 113 n=1 Tax=unclassified Paenibacillus TaxID=185978 RepID=UPI00097ACFB7|nr:hypothetical protein BK140_03010 [Paenibacillus macerans]GJM74614.1 hypothetical protein HMSSN036_68300 [Paenibacillus macerans]